MILFDEHICSDGLVQPPSSYDHVGKTVIRVGNLGDFFRGFGVKSLILLKESRRITFERRCVYELRGIFWLFLSASKGICLFAFEPSHIKTPYHVTCAFWKDTYQTVSKQEQPDIDE